MVTTSRALEMLELGSYLGIALMVGVLIVGYVCQRLGVQMELLESRDQRLGKDVVKLELLEKRKNFVNSVGWTALVFGLAMLVSFFILSPLVTLWGMWGTVNFRLVLLVMVIPCFVAMLYMLRIAQGIYDQLRFGLTISASRSELRRKLSEVAGIGMGLFLSTFTFAFVALEII